uniref:Syntaxin N-terminal domain-containing protein n=1 Tax=Nothobranchius furzeri TaxID=105023 RepID=A0A8C6KHV4_NOTFU
MRDMLERLIAIFEEDEELKSSGHKPDVDKDGLFEEAVIFDDSSVMDKILNEANSIRKETSLLPLQLLCAPSLTSKKDSDHNARGIQQQGEAVYVRIQALGKESRLLEQTEGPNSTVYRITSAQCDTLTHDFREAMNEYSKAEEKQRSACRVRIQRQASVLGKKIDDEQLDELVDKGGEGWTELSHDLQPQGGLSLRMVMRDLKGRHKELVELEARVKHILNCSHKWPFCSCAPNKLVRIRVTRMINTRFTNFRFELIHKHQQASERDESKRIKQQIITNFFLENKRKDFQQL